MRIGSREPKPLRRALIGLGRYLDEQVPTLKNLAEVVWSLEQRQAAE